MTNKRLACVKGSISHGEIYSWGICCICKHVVIRDYNETTVKEVMKEHMKKHGYKDYSVDYVGSISLSEDNCCDS